MKNVLITLSTILFLSFGITLWCAEYWVDVNTGNDSNSGNSKAAAWQTITYALTVISGKVFL